MTYENSPGFIVLANLGASSHPLACKLPTGTLLFTTADHHVSWRCHHVQSPQPFELRVVGPESQRF